MGPPRRCNDRGRPFEPTDVRALQSASLGRWCRVALSWRVVAIGLRTSLVVGTLLNVINHGEILLGTWSLHQLPEVVLNYLVPYLVATYGATSASVQRVQGH
jgi:hypothetical protein